jgi:two-component system, NtrC family, sensor kinase
MTASPTPMPAPALTLVGSIARLLNAGLGSDTTLASVTETLRGGLGAHSVTVWLREPGATAFHPVSAPPAAESAPQWHSPESIPLRDNDRRLPLEHDGIRLGLLDVALPLRQEDAELLPIVADLLAMYLGSLELSQDLAGEVATQSREIEEQRRFTSLIIDSLPLGLYVVDRDYRIQIWNRKRETGTQGLQRADVVGRPVFDVLTRQPAAQLRAEFDRVFVTGEIQQTELEVILGGQSRHFRLSKIPMRLDGDEITHVITVGEDVTEWRTIQGQIMQSEKLAAVGQLAAGVMHEINNPLATISACVAAIEGRLREGSPPAPVEEYLAIIEKEVDRCTRIVDGLLDFSRPKGQSKGPVKLDALVEQTLFLLKHHQRFRRLTVNRELDPIVPSASGNAEQLIQVLMALLLNAVDAMKQGGRLSIRTGRNPSRSDEVFIEVEDTGVGISREDQSKIFEPFYTTKPPGRGTGLGLSICYGIVEEHRGRIEVESTPGMGSVFRVYLPVAASS